MCKLRISAHKLNIEVGHYNKTPRNECFFCNTGEIEDEMKLSLINLPTVLRYFHYSLKKLICSHNWVYGNF
jgi:hypothetical protein